MIQMVTNVRRKTPLYHYVTEYFNTKQHLTMKFILCKRVKMKGYFI